MDFDTAKENIQPLASGRNVEQLETALIAETDQEAHEKLLEKRREFEQTIESYEGDDPLEPWYEYIVWVEQSYPKSGKESALYELLAKCLTLFEKDERYFQDRRMLKLYIKYIDSEPNPPEFYELLYNNGIGTMLADLYLCWAHYYDYCDNFEKAESVYRKGLDARAQPISMIEQAHQQFGFSMSRRLLYKEESAQREFRSAMDEQRLAMTSLRSHKSRHGAQVGSIRTGSAVKSHTPGRLPIDQRSVHQTPNAHVQVFEDENGAAASTSQPSTSVVQTIMNSVKKQENLREPGPWTKAKIKPRSATGTCSQKLAFPILEDGDLPPIPLPESENNFKRGIQLPENFVRANKPQTDIHFAHHRDDEPAKRTMPGYDKFMVFPAKNKSYSLEELAAYKWFKKRGIENAFTREQDTVWSCGHDVRIRLPPHFARRNLPQDAMPLSPFSVHEMPTGKTDGRKFGFDINLLYTKSEEYSPEEILQAKWLNGELMYQRRNEMELTCDFERYEENCSANCRRRSMAIGGRKSILPRKSLDSDTVQNLRRSLAPKVEANTPPTSQRASTDQQATTSQQTSTSNHSQNVEKLTGAIRKVSLSKRKSVHETIPEEPMSPPVLRRKVEVDVKVEKPPAPKFSIFTENESKEVEVGQNTFKTPQLPPSAPRPRVSSVFNQDDELEGCNTQTFNFFLQSQSVSTPKIIKTQMTPQALRMERDQMPKKELNFSDGNDSVSPHKEPANKDLLIDEQKNVAKQPFGCREEYAPQDAMEILHQKLATIMETTEDATTISSTATISSKSSSVEDFDYTKNTNKSVASTYRNLTGIQNQTSLSNVTRASTSIAAISMTKASETIKNPATSKSTFDIRQDADEEDPLLSKSTTADVTTEMSVLKGFNSTLKVVKPVVKVEAENDIAAMPIESKETKNVELAASPQFSIYEDAETVPLKSILKKRTSTIVTTDASAMQSNKGSEAPNNFEFNQTQTAEIPAMRLGGNETIANTTANKSIFTPQAPDQSMIPPMPVERFENLTINDVKDTEETKPETKSLPKIQDNQSKLFGNRSIFKMTKEDTAPSMMCMNFADERTETLTDLISNRFADKSVFPVLPNESIPMCPPNLPEDLPPPIGVTPPAELLHENTAKAAFNNSVRNGSGEKSVFNVYCDETENVYVKLDVAAAASNVSVKSTLQQNEQSCGDQIGFAINDQIALPSMSTKSIYICEDEQTANASHAVCKSQKVTKSNLTNKAIIDSEAANEQRSVFNIFCDENNATLNKSRGNVMFKESAASAINNCTNEQHKISGRETITPDDSKFAKSFNDQQKVTENQTDDILASNVSMEKLQLSRKPSVEDELYESILGKDTSKSVKSFSNQPKTIEDQSDLIAKNASANKLKSIEKPRSIDDELYNMINSPVEQTETINIPINLRKASNFALKQNQPVKLADRFNNENLLPSSVKDVSPLIHQKHVAPTQYFADEQGSFTTDVPNTALFSLNIEGIKNSTLISQPDINPIEIKENSLNIKQENVTVQSASTENFGENTLPQKSVTSGAIPKQSFNSDGKTDKKSDDLEEYYDMISKNDFSFDISDGEINMVEQGKTSVSIQVNQSKATRPNSMQDDLAMKIIEPRTIRPSQFPAPNDTMQTSQFKSPGGLKDDKRKSRPSLFPVQKSNDSLGIKLCEPRTIRPSQFPIHNDTMQTSLSKSSICLEDDKPKSRPSLFPSDSSSNDLAMKIVEPRTIRPSQFPTSNDTMHASSLKTSGSSENTKDKSMAGTNKDLSCYVIDDSMDMSTVTKQNKQINLTVTDDQGARSPFKSRFGNISSATTESDDTNQIIETDNPFDPEYQLSCLESIEFSTYVASLDNIAMTERVRALNVGQELEVKEKKFLISELLGKGSYGFVYSGTCVDTNKKYALKQERPPNFWELYISFEIPARIRDRNFLSAFVSIDWALIGPNSSVYIMELSEYGSLFEICNRHKATTCRPLDEIIVMLFAEQMLSVIDHLHGANIIHGDVKPDNFLLMKKLKYGSNEPVLKLIDYGHAIDLNFSRAEKQFTTVFDTKNFTCIEMMEGRPWKFQLDLFCLASTIYSLLCGKYMELTKQPGSSLRPYALSESLPPHLNRSQWENVLYALINVRDFHTLPNLQKLRLGIRECIAANEKFLSSKIDKFNAFLDESTA